MATGRLTGDAQRVDGCKGHDGDGDCCTGHVDGRTEGDGDRVELTVELEALAQGHVDGDVSGRGAGEECGDAAFLEALEHQRIRILADDDEHHDGVDDKGGKEHAADEDEQQLAVLVEDGKTAGGNCGEHETEDAEGCEIDNEADCLGDCLGGIGQELFRRVGCTLEHEAEDDCPEQNAEVVGVDDRADGVGNDVVKKAGEDGRKAVGSGIGGGLREGDGHGENEACADGDDCRKEGGDEVQDDNCAELLAHLLLGLCKCADDEYEHQQRGDGLQSADEQSAEDADAGCGLGGVGDEQGKSHADDHADNDAQHEAYAVIRFYDFHFFFLFPFKICTNNRS